MCWWIGSSSVCTDSQAEVLHLGQFLESIERAFYIRFGMVGMAPQLSFRPSFLYPQSSTPSGTTADTLPVHPPGRPYVTTSSDAAD
jgi:hypothetical protein